MSNLQMLKLLPRQTRQMPQRSCDMAKVVSKPCLHPEQQPITSNSTPHTILLVVSPNPGQDTFLVLPSGQYVDGKYNYSGEWSKDRMHGLGKFTYASGTCYNGQWEHSEYQGTGTFSWPDGRQYEVHVPERQCLLKSRCASAHVVDRIISRASHTALNEELLFCCTLSIMLQCAELFHQGNSAIISARVLLQGLWEHNRMHGQGTYTDAEGHQWSGQFFNGSGPGLTCLL